MAIALADNIQTGAPKPTDSRYFNNQVAWTGVTEANTNIGSGVRYSGLTVNINGEEYWYKDGIEDGDLILKTTGGGSATSGENVTKEITQSSHGFAVNDFIGWSGGTYNLAVADGLYDGEFVGLVTASADTNTFSVTQSGYITGLTASFAINTTYWLSEVTAGLLTSTEPSTDGEISKAAFVANSTSSGWVLPYRGVIVTSGSTSLSTAGNGLTDNGGIVELGGDLCQHTYVCLGGGSTSNNFSITNSGTTNCIDALYGPTGIVQTVYGVDTTDVYGAIQMADNIVVLRSGNGTDCCSCINVTPARITMTICETGSTDGYIKVCDNTVSQHGIQYSQCYSTGFTSDCSLVDKGYVDTCVGAGGCGDYSLTSPATCVVGGVSPGYVMTGKTLECIIQDAFAPYVEPAFSSFGVDITPQPFEVGCVQSGSKDFSWGTSTSGNVEPNTIGICYLNTNTQLATGLANDGAENLNIGTLTNTAPTTYTWQITGCSTQDTSFSRNVSKCSVYPYFWGVETCGTRPVPSNDIITGGTKVVNTFTTSASVVFNSVGQWTWFAMPSNCADRIKWLQGAAPNCGYIDRSNPTDKYPDSALVDVTSPDSCWSTIEYKVYMSGFAASDGSTPIQFRTN